MHHHDSNAGNHAKTIYRSISFFHDILRKILLIIIIIILPPRRKINRKLSVFNNISVREGKTAFCPQKGRTDRTKKPPSGESSPDS